MLYWHIGRSVVEKQKTSGWCKAVIAHLSDDLQKAFHWVESNLYKRQGRAQTNFETTLPALQSDLARETLKDLYKFRFLTIADDAEERELEQGLVAHLRQFLIELGAGFAFLGQQ